MKNSHSNGQVPVAIRRKDKVWYFESQKEAALFCGCSASLIHDRLKNYSEKPIDKEYIVDFGETEKLRRVAGFEIEKPAQISTSVKSANGYTWNIKENEINDPKLLIAKYGGKLSIKTMAELLDISTKEVRQLFEECWNDPAYEKYVRG